MPPSPDRLSKGLYWDRAWSLVPGCAEAFDLDLPLRTRKPRAWAVRTDLFHEAVSDRFILEALDVMRRCEVEGRGHVFIVLTKYSERMASFLERLRFDPGHLRDGSGGLWLVGGESLGQAKREQCYDEIRPGHGFACFLRSVWFGVRVESDAQAERLRCLVRAPAANKWVSAEPIRGPVPLVGYLGSGGIKWVVCSGETGLGGRPAWPEHVRRLRNECDDAGVPFFFRGVGGGGKKNLLLDGVERLSLGWEDLGWRESYASVYDGVRGKDCLS